MVRRANLSWRLFDGLVGIASLLMSYKFFELFIEKYFPKALLLAGASATGGVVLLFFGVLFLYSAIRG